MKTRLAIVNDVSPPSKQAEAVDVWAFKGEGKRYIADIDPKYLRK